MPLEIDIMLHDSDPDHHRIVRVHKDMLGPVGRQKPVYKILLGNICRLEAVAHPEPLANHKRRQQYLLVLADLVRHDQGVDYLLVVLTHVLNEARVPLRQTIGMVAQESLGYPYLPAVDCEHDRECHAGRCPEHLAHEGQSLGARATEAPATCRCSTSTDSHSAYLGFSIHDLRIKLAPLAHLMKLFGSRCCGCNRISAHHLHPG